MYKRSPIVLSAVCIVAIWLTCGCARQPPAADEETTAAKTPSERAGAATVFSDVSYVPGSNDPRQTMDIYVPSGGKKPWPVVIWIHGGAWIAGDKRDAPVEDLLNAGFAVASINYRLAKQAPFPAQIQDCKTAVRFLRARAQEYNLDPQRIGAWGMSAGGHLAALLGTSNGVGEFSGDGWNDQSDAVQCVSDYCGPADFPSLGRQSRPGDAIDFSDPNSPLHLLLARDLSPERLRWASPAHHATRHACPVEIVHGDADNVVPIAQSEALYKALVEKKAPVEFHRVPGGAHMIYSRKNARRTMEFFRRHLKTQFSPDSRSMPEKRSGKGKLCIASPLNALARRLDNAQLAFACINIVLFR